MALRYSVSSPPIFLNFYPRSQRLTMLLQATGVISFLGEQTSYMEVMETTSSLRGGSLLFCCESRQFIDLMVIVLVMTMYLEMMVLTIFSEIMLTISAQTLKMCTMLHTTPSNVIQRHKLEAITIGDFNVIRSHTMTSFLVVMMMILCLVEKVETLYLPKMDRMI